MPFPVIASVTTARTKPSMAARPLSCSEKEVKPCGIFSLLPITSVAWRRTGATARRLVKEVLLRTGAERARTGVAETNAIVGYGVWLVG